MTNDLFADKSFYFRNALVRANYENQRLNVEKTQLPLEEFFKVLIYGDEIELRNRFLKVGQKYGTPAGEAVKGLHRRDDGIKDGIHDGIKVRNVVINDAINNPDVVINDVIKFTGNEEKAIKAIAREPGLSATRLAELLGVKHRQAQRIIASLKKKAGLVREGSRKSGIWRFPHGVQI